ncbi:MAG: hypothetical protein ACHQM6_01755 [Candidatus Kapaibacterium sp.]
MNTATYYLRVTIAFIIILLTGIISCKKASDDEVWVETSDIVIQPYKSDPVDGKQYLDVIYENVGHDTYRKIKYQLIRRTGTKIDTTERIILPETVFVPKDKHLVPRHIGQSVATFDEVKAGKVWGVVDTKK